MSLFKDLSDDAAVHRPLPGEGPTEDRDEVCRIRTFYKDVIITSAEILALDTVPKEIIPAPGTGKILQFRGAHVFLDYFAAAKAIVAIASAAITTGTGILYVRAFYGVIRHSEMK